MRITLVTGKHALLIVSRIICFTSVCSSRFSTLTIVKFCFMEKLSTNIYVAKEQPLACLSINLIMLVQEYTLNEISNAPKTRFVCLFFWLPLNFLGTLILSVF